VKYPDLLASVRRALSGREYFARVGKTDRDSGSPCASFSEIVGESESMQALCELIERVAETNANVLITGESGTGKEVVAKAVHRKSRRASSAFQVIDCTAIPDSLFESVLFGHVKGAFTGAVNDQPGLLRQADGGTAFFDEVGELPLTLQSKLLRVIQEQTFTPVGKHSLVRIDTRFLCATNRDLESEVNTGRFRQDLFYRLAVIHLEIPPLRERGQDILLLARHFLRELQQSGVKPKELSPEAEMCLLRYSWPGNVRELRNAIERGVVMARSEQILPSDLPGAVHNPPSIETRLEATQGSSRIDALQDAERDYLIGLLQKNSGNVARSAKEAGMSRQGLHKLLKKHAIDAAEYRP
jgi:DNA-binding NtrC family response regulator